MKQLIILIIALSLTACGMDVEEYNARVKYCNNTGMGIVTENGGVYSNKEVINVFCKDKQGNLLKSKEVK